MRARGWFILFVIALLLGSVTGPVVALLIAATRPLPDEPPMSGGAFINWGEAWHLVIRDSFGIVIAGWSIRDETTVRPGAPLGTAEQRAAELQQWLREELMPQRPQYRMLDHPPRWGTFGRAERPPQTYGSIADYGFGWPTLCMQFHVYGVTGINAQGVHTVSNEVIEGGHVMFGSPSTVVRNFRALPLRPIPSGLLINAVFFTLVWFVLVAAPGVIRRRMRRSRGCCVACGYDLRGSSGTSGGSGGRCPECGAASAAPSPAARPA